MARLDVAVIKRDGDALIVNATRPATLVAFTDAHDGKVMPETVREIAWVVHHALGLDGTLDEWLESLEAISALPEDVAIARRIIDGDERARRIALGTDTREDRKAEAEEADALADPTRLDPAIEQVEEAETLAAISGGG